VTQAKEALERRKHERQRMDELMRNPNQQPPPARKPILRKGARQPASPVLNPSSPPPDSKQQLDRVRREWREGLKEFIARQRGLSSDQVSCCTSLPPSTGSEAELLGMWIYLCYYKLFKSTAA
jgi:hypothetical protein